MKAARLIPLRTIDFGDLGLGDAMMAWAGLHALLVHGHRPLAPGCRLYVPRELAGLATYLFEPYGLQVEGVRPFRSRPQVGPVFTASPPKTFGEWRTTFAGPDWRLNAFAALDSQKSIPLPGFLEHWSDRLLARLTEAVFYRRLGLQAAAPDYIGFRLWRPLASRLGLPPAPFLTLMKRSLPQLRAEAAAYLGPRASSPPPRIAIFPAGRAFQAFPPALCRRLLDQLPREETAFYISADDPWMSEYRAAGIEPHTLDSADDLMKLVATAPCLLTTDSFASHVAQTLRDDFLLVLTRDVGESVIHPGAHPRVVAQHPPCAPCSYLARTDSPTCSAGHANCLAFDDANFARRLSAALLSRIVEKAEVADPPT